MRVIFSVWKGGPTWLFTDVPRSIKVCLKVTKMKAIEKRKHWKRKHTAKDYE